MVGFSDVPITLPLDAPSYYGCIETKHANKYFGDYIHNHVYSESSLWNETYSEKRDEKTDKTDGMWTVGTMDFNTGQQGFRYSRLVITVGLTSVPDLHNFLLDQ